MAPFGVRVLCIEPGFFKTNVTDAGILSKSINGLWERLPQEVRDDYGPQYMQKGTSGSLYLLHSFIHNSSLYLFHIFPFLALALLKDKVAKMSDADLMKVVSCMEHAVSAVRPRTRYSAGWDAKLFWLPLSYMPSFVFDYIMTMEAIPIARQMQ